MKRLEIIEIIAFTVVMFVIGTLVGVALSNNTRREYWTPELNEAVKMCEADGLSSCHIEKIKRGAVVVDYEIVGEKGE